MTDGAATVEYDPAPRFTLEHEGLSTALLVSPPSGLYGPVGKLSVGPAAFISGARKLNSVMRSSMIRLLLTSV